MNWPTVRIGQVCEPTEMRDPRRKPNESFSYVDISAVDRRLKVIRSAVRILGAEAPSRARKEVREDDVIISSVRPNLNAVAVVPRELDRQIASTGFCVLRSRRNLVIPKYLFYFATTPSFVAILMSKARGAHYPAVSDNDIKDVEMPLPPLSEQRRIVEILDIADALRTRRDKSDEKERRIIPALFRTMFGDPIANPFRWKFSPLGELGAEVRYGLGQPPALSTVGVPLLRATNVSAGQILTDDLINVDPEDVPPGRNAFLRADEVLVVRSGAYTGDVAQVTDKWEGAVAGYDLVISPGPRLLGEFLEA